MGASEGPIQKKCLFCLRSVCIVPFYAGGKELLFLSEICNYMERTPDGWECYDIGVKIWVMGDYEMRY